MVISAVDALGEFERSMKKYEETKDISHSVNLAMSEGIRILVIKIIKEEFGEHNHMIYEFERITSKHEEWVDIFAARRRFVEYLLIL